MRCELSANVLVTAYAAVKTQRMLGDARGLWDDSIDSKMRANMLAVETLLGELACEAKKEREILSRGGPKNADLGSIAV
jgi:hypothetical protein